MQPALADLKVRQAIAYAIEPDALVELKLPEGAKVASQLHAGHGRRLQRDVTTYPYDPAKAKELLAEAGCDGPELQFHYPTEVSRPYMPNPKEIFSSVERRPGGSGHQGQGAAGQVGAGLPGRPPRASKDHDIHLLGWTGDYNDADNFIGTFFDRPKDEWGFNDKALFDQLARTRTPPPTRRPGARSTRP